jgi:peptide deformylase
MAILQILRYPDPRLRETCKPLGDALDGLPELVRDMADSMYAVGGAGLAAIQLGISKRLFIVDSEIAGLDPKAPPMVFIDPEILELGDETEISDEGCLSFPGVYIPVKRSFTVSCKARDLSGEPFEVEAEGLFARAIQHEYDHLNGRLLSDYVGRIKRKMMERRMAREAEAEDEE